MADAAYATDSNRGMDQEWGGTGRAEGFTVHDLARWAQEGSNVAEELDKHKLDRIGQQVIRDYEVDKNSREDKEKAWAEAVKLAKQVEENKNYPWPMAANVKFPAITVAAIQFAARSYPAIVSSAGVVKGKVIGSDAGMPQMGPDGQPVMQPGPDGQPQPVWQVPPGFKQSKADRIASHMSYQVLEEMEEWEADTDKLLHVLPIYGTAFRKTWFDPDLRRNRSRLVLPEDLVVNSEAESLERAPRLSEHIPLYKSEYTERVRMGIFIDAEVPFTEDEDPDPLHQFIEQHRTYDLDDDGYPEPYICTVHKDSGKVCRIVARFDADGIVMKDDEVAKIEPVHYYTKYPFVPSPDSSFYDLGFADLLGPLNRSINSTINALLNAGHLQITGGGFISAELQIKAGEHRFRPGEWKRIEAPEGDISKAVLPLPAPEPSMVLFQLLQLLIDASREVSSIQDVMTGEQPPQGQTATATLALIEQGMKVFTAIHKRIYRALKVEFRKLRRLNKLYLDPQVYQAIMDDPRAGPDDYANDTFDVVPTADPSMLTDMQKLARAEALMALKDDPMLNGRDIRVRYLRALGVEEADNLVAKQPPPNPMLMAEADRIDIEKQKIEVDKRKVQIDADKAEVETAKMLSEILLNIAKAEAEEAGTQLGAYEAETARLVKAARGGGQ